MDDLKKLEDSLWEAADRLRANSKLNATEYSMPVLGLIFLRHATNRFEDVHTRIQARLPSRGGKTRPITSTDFKSEGAIFLPVKARYGYIADLSEGDDIGRALKEAMELIEKEEETLLAGVLPKEYPKFDPDLLRSLIRVFNSDALRKPTRDDLFGRIYEYFLNKFAMSGAQEGGEFFTPPSIVRTIVNFIEPTHGVICDPACGSAGMFVQAAHAIEERGDQPASVASFVGQEKSETNTRLARMNLAVHGLEGSVLQGNTYYDRLPQRVGQCDFVMANPPFNVDMVDPKKLAGDPRLLAPVKELGVSKKTNTVSNANYLWIQCFYGYLKPTGRTGFVMAQSATDAGHWEQKLRRKLVETGDVDIMVSIGTNFFYTRSLPCSLWFLERGRTAEQSHRTLMLDARSVYRTVSRKIRDFSDEQLANLTAVVWLYRGETVRYLRLVADYLQGSAEATEELTAALDTLDAPLVGLQQHLTAVHDATPEDADPEAKASFEATITDLAAASSALTSSRASVLEELANWRGGGADVGTANDAQTAWHDAFEPFVPRLRSLKKQVLEVHKLANRGLDLAKRDLGATKWDAWDGRQVGRDRDAFDAARHEAVDAIDDVLYPFSQATWLQTRFPDGVFAEVKGLCRVVRTEQIEEQDWSLTPGRYVGVAPKELEDEDAVETRLRQIHVELQSLNMEAAELGATIAGNFEGLLG